ncbi:AsmA family protein [Roseomonas sp. SSH11]|uniref:AsmA family protein n=1 Tax=Pararoseomonas baculiformis TaxID=2820812 RepID=A0ABS4AD29_9PROT|nr:AsmA family protein [Pararoseomonas baculiformis]MBP0444917.1 AsmA family protein [Pararoseomonas baculiformis]
MTEPATPGRDRRSRLRRLRPWLVALGLLVIGLPLAAYGAIWVALRSDAVRPRVEAAVEAATGRRFTLGALTIRPALVPTIGIENPVLANPPGFSRPEMLRARRIEAELALIPLLSRQVELRRLALVEPDLLLEIGPEGRGNWEMGRQRPEAPGTAPAAPPADPDQPFGLAVDAVTIERGRVTWRSPGHEEVVELPRLTLRGTERSILAEGQAVLRGVTATVNGGTGPLAVLLAGGPGEWPFQAGLSAPGLNVEASGSLALPFRPDGWRLRLAATADSAARLAPLLPGTPLPAARNLSAVADAGAAGLGTLHVSAAEVSLPLGGQPLSIGPVQLSATAPDAPVTLNGSLRLGDIPVALAVQGPSLDAVRGGGALPLLANIEGEGLAASLRGSLGQAGRVEGTEWLFSLRAADLRALGARAGRPDLPALHDASADGRVRVTAEGAELPSVTLTSREAVGRGSLSWRRGEPVPRLRLQAMLDRLDADALSVPAAGAAPQAAPQGQPTPPPATETAPARAANRVIPDSPIDLSAVRDAPLALEAEGSVALLRLRGADWRDITLRAVLQGQALKLERFAAGTPGGPVTGALSAEAGGPVPRLALTLRSGAGGVDPAPLLSAFGIRSPVSGPGALDLALNGEGAGTRALAASLGGHIGLAMTGGQVDPRLLAGATQALRGIVPENTAGEAAEIRCVALRFDLQAGVAQSRALLVQTGVATVTGGGAANLGDETLAFRLRPVVRVGDVSLTTPVGITGRFANPRFSVDPNAAAAAAAGVLGGLARRSDDRETAALGALAESLLGGRNGAPGAADCAEQLAVARGAAPAVGTPPAPAPEPQRERRPAVQDLLRGLLGR